MSMDDTRVRVLETEPKPSSSSGRNRVSPYRSRRVGGSRGPTMAVRVEEEGGSERRPVIGRIRTKSSGAKARRLPSGLLSRDSLANRLRTRGR